MGIGAADLKRFLAGVAFLALTNCGGSSSTPAPEPLPSDLLFLTSGPSGTAVVEARDGSTVAQFPGRVVATLDQGGDVSEAYVLTAPLDRPSKLSRLTSLRPLTLETIAAPELREKAVLVPAPNLATFVGRKTVLIVVRADGGLIGYQHGSVIWQDPAPRPDKTDTSLFAWDGIVVTETDRGLARVAPESGALAFLNRPCPGMPVVQVAGGLAYACGSPSPRLAVAPNGPTSPLGTAPGGLLTTVRPVTGGLTFVISTSPGSVDAIDGTGKVVWQVAGQAGFEGAAVAPDGSAVFLASPSGVRIVSTHMNKESVISESETLDVAVSRDGTLIYVTTPSALDIFDVRTRSRRASYPQQGAGAIQLVAGG